MSKGTPARAQPGDDDGTLRIGVSSCLLGEEVRFDGGHKRDRFLTDELARYARFVPVCPEVEVGMGIPRETVRLVTIGAGAAAATRLVAPASGVDWTERMETFARARVEKLARHDLDGYVLKKDSPSCGMERVKRYTAGASASHPPARDGRGLYAAALMARFPLLPVEEDGRLQDARLRETFVERVFAYRRLRTLFRPGGRWTVGELVRFHTGEKLLLMAHEPAAYTALGRLVAAAKPRPRAEVAEEYASCFMGALARPATTHRHVNVLQHMAGYFKKSLDDGDREELHASIAAFGDGLVPLVVPLARRRTRRSTRAAPRGRRRRATS